MSSSSKSDGQKSRCPSGDKKCEKQFADFEERYMGIKPNLNIYHCGNDICHGLLVIEDDDNCNAYSRMCDGCYKIFCAPCMISGLGLVLMEYDSGKGVMASGEYCRDCIRKDPDVSKGRKVVPFKFLTQPSEETKKRAREYTDACVSESKRKRVPKRWNGLPIQQKHGVTLIDLLL
jgi:hypothetical protein